MAIRSVNRAVLFALIVHCIALYYVSFLFRSGVDKRVNLTHIDFLSHFPLTASVHYIDILHHFSGSVRAPIGRFWNIKVLLFCQVILLSFRNNKLANKIFNKFVTRKTSNDCCLKANLKANG